MTDEQTRIKELIESAVEEAKYPVTILGAPLKTDQTGWWTQFLT